MALGAFQIVSTNLPQFHNRTFSSLASFFLSFSHHIHTRPLAPSLAPISVPVPLVRVALEPENPRRAKGFLLFLIFVFYGFLTSVTQSLIVLFISSAVQILPLKFSMKEQEKLLLPQQENFILNGFS